MAADWTLEQLRAAALEVFLELQGDGFKAEQSADGTGLPHAMFLCYCIGRRVDNAQQARGYLGFVQAILIYERQWTTQHMLDRAREWSGV